MQNNADDVFDYYGLSEYLKMTPGTLRQMVMKGEIPHFKIGRRVRFSKEQINNWLKKHQQDLKQTENKHFDGDLFPAPEIPND